MNYESMTDAMLAELAKAGDTGAGEALALRQRARLLRMSDYDLARLRWERGEPELSWPAKGWRYGERK